MSTGKFSRNSWVTDNQSRLLGGSPGTPGPRNINHVYWEVLQELLGHGWSILSTGKFSRNSWVTDNQSCLLGGSPGTPVSRTDNFVYWEVLQELLGHGQSITSTGRFSRNSWATDNQSRLLGGSPGTPGPRTINHVYWEVLQELLGHGRSILSTGKFSRNSWVTDNQSSLLGGSPGTPGPRTVNFVYWEVLQELLGHGQSIKSTGKFSRNSWVTKNQSRLLGVRVSKDYLRVLKPSLFTFSGLQTRCGVLAQGAWQRMRFGFGFGREETQVSAAKRGLHLHRRTVGTMAVTSSRRGDGLRQDIATTVSLFSDDNSFRSIPASLSDTANQAQIPNKDDAENRDVGDEQKRQRNEEKNPVGGCYRLGDLDNCSLQWSRPNPHLSPGLSLLEYPGVKPIDPAYALPVDVTKDGVNRIQTLESMHLQLERCFSNLEASLLKNIGFGSALEPCLVIADEGDEKNKKSSSKWQILKGTDTFNLNRFLQWEVPNIHENPHYFRWFSRSPIISDSTYLALHVFPTVSATVGKAVFEG
ncbi:hypothetical protein V8G54_026520 [Vigna mungo]|uniref:Uncharacterized protein n=1 Tax=Vigna mungo TaxID=3915 RepID=A0AAQ3RQK4_VIGMU